MRFNYVCMECETEFDEPQVYEEGHGLDTMPFETIMTCPNCGSGYYMQPTYCDLCEKVIIDEYIVTIDDQYICNDCYSVRHIDSF